MENREVTPIRSSLGGLPSGPTSDEDLERMARIVWLKRGIAVIFPAHLKDDWERQFIENLCSRIWGERK